MESFEEDDESENDDEREVGYRKPPKHSQFKKGHSGNPRGKPRGTKNSATLLEQALLASVRVKQNGRQTKTTKLQVIVRQMVQQAMKGDYTSIRLLFKYAGLERQLNEPERENGGLSAATVDAIRRAIAGVDEPDTQEGGESETEPLACPQPEPRPGKEILRQPYQVGYRKPPEHTRFQKGRSGNPFGRPRAPKTLRMLIVRTLDEEVSVTENGQQRLLTRIAVIFTRIVNKAAMGDQKFQALVLEYAPAVDIKHRRRLTTELLERANLMVRGSLDSIDV